MDALALLKQDHDKVRELFKQFEASSDEKEHRELFGTIKTELQTHTHIEETVFYPAVEDQGNDELSEMVQEAFDEHAEVNDLIEELDGVNEENGELRTKVIELKDKVEHHAQEEESEMFPKVRGVIGQDELNRLGEELQSEKKSFSSLAA